MRRVAKSVLWFILVGICTHEIQALLSSFLLAFDGNFEMRPIWQRDRELQASLFFLECAGVFFIAGAVLVAPYGLRAKAAVATAFLFGTLFSALFVLGPYGLAYSHAPLWLDILGYSPFFVPPFAAIFGALAIRQLRKTRAVVT